MTAGSARADRRSSVSCRTVGIVSPGEMGHGLGQVLRAAGLRAVTCVRGRSQRTVALASDAGLEAVPELADVVAEADLFMSLVPPAQALTVARDVAAALAKTGASLLYADCNSIAPRTVDAIEQVIGAAGARFVDVSIIGPPPRVAGGVVGSSPRIYASGQGAADFARLSETGLDVTVLAGGQAQASSLKMCYAALLKGLLALSAELLVASDLLQVRGPLLAQFEATQPALLETMRKTIPGMPPKAQRWVGEMEQMEFTFADAGLAPHIFQGAGELFGIVSRTELGSEVPENRRRGTGMDEVIDIIADAVRAARTA